MSNFIPSLNHLWRWCTFWRIVPDTWSRVPEWVIIQDSLDTGHTPNQTFLRSRQVFGWWFGDFLRFPSNMYAWRWGGQFPLLHRVTKSLWCLPKLSYSLWRLKTMNSVTQISKCFLCSFTCIVFLWTLTTALIHSYLPACCVLNPPLRSVEVTFFFQRPTGKALGTWLGTSLPGVAGS